MEIELFATVIAVSLIVPLLSLVVVIAIVTYKRKQERFLREKAAIEKDYENRLMLLRIKVQEDTLKSLSKELHDNVCQLMGSAKNMLGLAQRELKIESRSYNTATEILEEAIKEARGLARTLNHDWLNRFELIENVKREVERINESTGIKALLTVTGSDLDLSRDAQLVLFRVIQEALQNTVRHADANILSVSINNETDILQIVLQDDGKGFDPQHTAEGLGLMNIQERVQLLDGSIEWQTAPGKGTKILIAIKKLQNAKQAITEKL